MLQFNVQTVTSAPGSSARTGRLQLSHGTVETPVFMPVGTYGAVRTAAVDELSAVGTQILLGNTFHLNLRPGPELLRKLGGLHGFMRWDRPILTDSGGFQVFSLSHTSKVKDGGVEFRSPLNGEKIFMTPEGCARIQQAIGSDIAMVLDVCLSLPASREALRGALETSLEWARRFLAVPREPGQAIFGIVQGGTEDDLRRESLERTLALGPNGIAIGGLSVGEPFEQMCAVLEGLRPHLPPEKPHYLMGVGTPLDILEAVHRGVDMFDCVLPTRNARNGGFFTDEGLLSIRNARFRDDPNPIVEGCPCPCCRKYSRAYLRHLFQCREILGLRLATLHNLHYYHAFMLSLRRAIDAGRWEVFYRERRSQLAQSYRRHARVAGPNEDADRLSAEEIE